jgi:hypothetical protein
VAEDVDGSAGAVPCENCFDVQFVKRNQSGAGYVSAGIFRRGADIEQFEGTAAREEGRELSGRNGAGLDFHGMHM